VLHTLKYLADNFYSSVIGVFVCY